MSKQLVTNLAQQTDYLGSPGCAGHCGSKLILFGTGRRGYLHDRSIVLFRVVLVLVSEARDRRQSTRCPLQTADELCATQRRTNPS